ncbi:hypothetical protein D3C73_1368400 [compost metagenome]
MAAGQVGRPHGCSQSVVCGIGQPHRFLLRVERVQHSHGSKDLVAVNVMVRREAAQEGGLQVGIGALDFEPLTAEKHLTFGASPPNPAFDVVRVGAADEGAVAGQTSQRIRGPVTNRSFCKQGCELVMDVPLHQDP